ncbi:MAG: HU family DNA-binding protein [Muribaculaceae bacterium]|nr:HU family DNA-binding protein [Muribaculaceae bacterium]
MDNKTFIETLSSRLDISLTTVSTMIESLREEFATQATELDSIVISGFGSFEPRLREERVSVHPASGKRLLVPPRIYLAFKQSPVLKQKINNKPS